MRVVAIDYQSPSAPAELACNLHERGFAVIRNYPIPWGLVESIYAEWDRFFASAAKHRYEYSIERQDGYFARPGSGSGSSPGTQVNGRDDKEFYHLFRWGRIPVEVSGNALRYWRLAADLGATLIGWLDDHTPSHVVAKFPMSLSDALVGSSDQTLLRIIRYPSLDGTHPRAARRAGAHKDTNLLTILASGSTPGLQVHVGGSWQAIPWDSSSLVVNGGVILDKLSDGYYPAVAHRVVSTHRGNDMLPRLAMPLFLHPAPDVVVQGTQTAAEYLESRRLAMYAAGPGSVPTY